MNNETFNKGRRMNSEGCGCFLILVGFGIFILCIGGCIHLVFR